MVKRTGSRNFPIFYFGGGVAAFFTVSRGLPGFFDPSRLYLPRRTVPRTAVVTTRRHAAARAGRRGRAHAHARTVCVRACVRARVYAGDTGRSGGVCTATARASRPATGPLGAATPRHARVDDEDGAVDDALGNVKVCGVHLLRGRHEEGQRPFGEEPPDLPKRLAHGVLVVVGGARARPTANPGARVCQRARVRECQCVCVRACVRAWLVGKVNIQRCFHAGGRRRAGRCRSATAAWRTGARVVRAAAAGEGLPGAHTVFPRRCWVVAYREVLDHEDGDDAVLHDARLLVRRAELVRAQRLFRRVQHKVLFRHDRDVRRRLQRSAVNRTR